MKKMSLLLVAALLGGLLAGCAPKQSSSIRLPVGYIPDIQFAPLYVAIEKGFYTEEGLDVVMDYNRETDSVALVGAGELQFAIVSGEQVLLGRAQGLPVVYIMAWYEDYPLGVVSLAETGIRIPQDLKGKKIGIPGLYGASYIGLKALLNAGSLSEGEVRLDSIGFTQVEALINGVDEAVVIYISNEPNKLRAEGYDVNVLAVADYLSLVGNGLITSEEVLEKQPELARKMARATARGIIYAAEHPDEAFEISKKYVEALGALSEGEQEVRRQVLAASIELWQVAQPGYSDPQAWQNMQELLLQMGLLEQPLALEQAFSNAYLAE